MFTKTEVQGVFILSAATEICERMGSLGLQRNLVTYFTTKIHLSNPKAANTVSNFVGALYLTPFIGGFLADAYWGRFWAITAFASIQVAVSSHSLVTQQCHECDAIALS
jgi:dipeptide/tripeptide permease